MRFLSNTSEYIGTRVAMHDALQRYYGQDLTMAGDTEKVALLQQSILAACADNRLLGDRKESVGKAWAGFLGTCDPAKVAAFVADPMVIAYSQKEPQLSTIASSLSFVKALTLLPKKRNFDFEQIAQRSGLIDYAAGETLSQHLKAAEQRLVNAGEPVQPLLPETPENAEAIKGKFDTIYGNVDPQDMGLPPKSHTDGLNKPSDGKGLHR